MAKRQHVTSGRVKEGCELGDFPTTNHSMTFLLLTLISGDLFQRPGPSAAHILLHTPAVMDMWEQKNLPYLGRVKTAELKLASEIRSKQEFPYLFSLGTSALNTKAILSGVSDDLRLNCWTVIFFRFDFKCPHATTAKPNADALSFGQGMFKNRHRSPHRHECTDPKEPLCADAIFGGLA